MVRQLHVLGVSDEGDALILGADKGKPSYRVPLDDRLRSATRGKLASNAERGEMALTPKEIQARLRAGETIEQIAKAAQVPPARIQPYAVPVEAERQRVVDQARAAHLHRARGPEGEKPLGEVVDAHLAEVAGLKPESVEWTARRRPDGAWVVALAYAARGGRRTAAWLWRPLARDVSALDASATRLAAEESSGRRRSSTRRPAAPRPAAKRTTRKTARKAAKKPAAKPATKPATKKQTAKKAPAKAAPKRAAAKRPAAKRPAAKRPATTKAATKPVTRRTATAKKAAPTPKRRAAATKPPVKKAVAKKAVATRAAKPTVKKVATTKAAVPRKAAPKVTPKQTPAKPAAKRAAPKPVTVKKAVAKKAPARKVGTRKPAARTRANPAKPFRPTLVETPPTLAPVEPIVPMPEPVAEPVAAPAAEARPNVRVIPPPAARKRGQRVPVPSWSDVLMGVRPAGHDDADGHNG